MKKIYGDKAWRHEGRHGRGPHRIHPVEKMRRDGSCDEDSPIREVFRRADMPRRSGEYRATESNLFNARCRIAAEINRRNGKRSSGCP